MVGTIAVFVVYDRTRVDCYVTWYTFMLCFGAKTLRNGMVCNRVELAQTLVIVDDGMNSTKDWRRCRFCKNAARVYRVQIYVPWYSQRSRAFLVVALHIQTNDAQTRRPRRR